MLWILSSDTKGSTQSWQGEGSDRNISIYLHISGDFTQKFHLADKLVSLGFDKNQHNLIKYTC